MTSPVDSSGSPGSHRSASARPSASLAGTEEAADLRVWAAVARERTQHVSCSATGLTCIPAAGLSSLTALAAGTQHLLPAASPIILVPGRSCAVLHRVEQPQLQHAAVGKVGLLVMPTPAECSSWLSA